MVLSEVDMNTKKYWESTRVKGAYRQGYNKALEDLKNKIDDEYCDGDYGDYHEVEMIVRMIEQLRRDKT